MTIFPSLIRCVSSSGVVRYRLGDPLVDRYLEFVAGRARPHTLRAVAFDLKTFFMVVAKDPTAVVAPDVFDFLADQRGDRSVVRLGSGVWVVRTHDRAAVVVGVGVLRVFDRAR